MTVVFHEYFSPSCDFCGHMLAAEKGPEAAEAAKIADGWKKVPGTDRSGAEVLKDMCRLCQMKEGGGNV